MPLFETPDSNSLPLTGSHLEAEVEKAKRARARRASMKKARGRRGRDRRKSSIHWDGR